MSKDKYFAGLSEDNHLAEAYQTDLDGYERHFLSTCGVIISNPIVASDYVIPRLAEIDMENEVHQACINTMGFDEPIKMYSSKSQFPPPNDTSEIEEIPLYTESEIYNEVIEWLELEYDEYLEGFNRDKLLSYCVAIENE